MIQAFQDDERNEIARDNEKDINAGKASGQSVWKGMKHNHCEHGNGTQTINIGSTRYLLAHREHFDPNEAAPGFVPGDI